MRYLLASLACLVLVLGGCQPAGTVTTAPEAAATEAPAAAEATPTEEAVATEEVTSSEEMTSTGMTDDEKITSAMSAGPAFITANAAVLDWPRAEGEKPVELRAGTNGWLCRPDDPFTPVHDPRCFDANWQQINGKAFGAEREAHNALGTAYMLQGGNAANNDDPSVMEPAAGMEWQTDPPHVMVNLPIEWDLSVYAHEHDSGGPWVMFGGTPVEHMMFPIEMVPVESEAGDDKIANAVSAGPTWIREGAGVIDWPTAAGGEVVELRPSTNGWTCITDSPGSPTNDPMCLDEQWVTWLKAYLAGAEPEITAVGFAYMLQGGSDASNTDPALAEPAAGDEWVVSPPHVMFLSPEPLDLSLYSADHHDGGPWVMFGGTPYEHIMMPLTDPIDHGH